MSVALSVADVLSKHVTLTVESIDRVYLSVMIQPLQTEGGIAWYFRTHRGVPFAKGLGQMTGEFIRSIEAFADQHRLPLVSFPKGERKETQAKAFLETFPRSEGVMFIGKAQEKAPVARIVAVKNPQTGQKYPRLAKSSVMVNHYYFYCLDEDFGPFFIKFCSYFPYNAKLCINGHEYAKQQLKKEGIAFEPLENGFRSCADPKRLQEICDGLSAEKIQALWKKWEARLPHGFPVTDRAARLHYTPFIQQIEFARTQVFDRPLSGRLFFEQMLRDNLDLGRPNALQLIFARRIPGSTKTRYRTRLLTQDVVPSLWLDYKRSSMKQYFKEGRALRTELTVNHTRDFGIGKALHNLPQLRELGFTANRRLLHVQQLSHDPILGEDEFQTLTSTQTVNGQRVSGLRFGDPMVLSVLTALLMFRHLPQGFSNKTFRQTLAHLLARPAHEIKPGQMTYQLRRLRIRGLILRVPKSNRYEITDAGQRMALFYVLSFSRVIRPRSQDLDQQNFQQRCLRALQKVPDNPVHFSQSKT